MYACILGRAPSTGFVSLYDPCHVATYLTKIDDYYTAKH